MKRVFTFILILISFKTFSQELNIGGNLGICPIYLGMFIIGGTLEYKPEKPIISINTDPNIIFYKDRIVLTEPIYLKLNIGNRLRFCPTFGAFIRSGSSYGWSIGLNVEYKIKEKLILFMKGELDKDFWKDQYPNHFGGSTEYINSGYSLWIGFGIKKNILH